MVYYYHNHFEDENFSLEADCFFLPLCLFFFTLPLLHCTKNSQPQSSLILTTFENVNMWTERYVIPWPPVSPMSVRIADLETQGVRYPDTGGQNSGKHGPGVQSPVTFYFIQSQNIRFLIAILKYYLCLNLVSMVIN